MILYRPWKTHSLRSVIAERIYCLLDIASKKLRFPPPFIGILLSWVVLDDGYRKTKEKCINVIFAFALISSFALRHVHSKSENKQNYRPIGPTATSSYLKRIEFSGSLYVAQCCQCVATAAIIEKSCCVSQTQRR